MNPNVPRQGNSTGFIIATVVVLAIILAGVAYFWKARSDDSLYDFSPAAESTSDATADIEADLNATDVNNVDYDLTESNFTSS